MWSPVPAGIARPRPLDTVGFSCLALTARLRLLPVESGHGAVQGGAVAVASVLDERAISFALDAGQGEAIRRRVVGPSPAPPPW